MNKGGLITSSEVESKRQKTVRILAHLLCFCIIFIVPEMLLALGRPEGDIRVTPMMYIKATIYLLVFYINYFFIIPWMMTHRHGRLRFYFWNLILAILTVSMLYGMIRWMHLHWTPFQIREMNVAKTLGFLLRDFIVFVLTVSLAVALRMSNIWIRMDRREKELQAIQRGEELKNLKSQLNPHFLFNTLNSIYALITISPPKAQSAVHELSTLLRYVLYENSESVPLREETAFVENYVKLMELRLPRNRTVSLEINIKGSEEKRIAPLLFINVIENLFKHGISGDALTPLTVSIRANQSEVILTTTNPPPTQKKEVKSGIGLINLERRLALLYGDKASVSIYETEEEYKVELHVPLELNNH